MSGREWHDAAVVVVRGEMPACVCAFACHILWADQRHDAAWHEPIRCGDQKPLLNAPTSKAVIERWIQPDAREGVRAGTTAKEAGWGQDMGIRQRSVQLFRTAIVQLDAVNTLPWTAKDFRKLADRRTFTSAGIEDGAGTLLRWLQESSGVSDGFWCSRVETTTHLGSKPHR